MTLLQVGNCLWIWSKGDNLDGRILVQGPLLNRPLGHCCIAFGTLAPDWQPSLATGFGILLVTYAQEQWMTAETGNNLSWKAYYRISPDLCRRRIRLHGWRALLGIGQDKFSYVKAKQKSTRRQDAIDNKASPME